MSCPVASAARVNRSAEAEAWLDRALETARAQGGASWELRAAAALAELHRNHGDATSAGALLAPMISDTDLDASDHEMERAAATLASLN